MSDDLEAEIRTELGATKRSSPQLDAIRETEDAAVAQRWGITTDQARFAREHSIPPADFVYAGPTAEDAVEAEARGKAIRKAQADAELRRLIDET